MTTKPHIAVCHSNIMINAATTTTTPIILQSGYNVDPRIKTKNVLFSSWSRNFDGALDELIFVEMDNDYGYIICFDILGKGYDYLVITRIYQ